jgi:hypothetical protein
MTRAPAKLRRLWYLQNQREQEQMWLQTSATDKLNRLRRKFPMSKLNKLIASAPASRFHSLPTQQTIIAKQRCHFLDSDHTKSCTEADQQHRHGRR